MAAKRHKNHKNKITGQINSMCYNEQKSRFRLFTNPSSLVEEKRVQTNAGNICSMQLKVKLKRQFHRIQVQIDKLSNLMGDPFFPFHKISSMLNQSGMMSIFKVSIIIGIIFLNNKACEYG